MKKKVCAAAVITLALGTTAACSSSGGTSASGGSALTAHGPVVDLGCGRGEMLELLLEAGVLAQDDRADGLLVEVHR